MVMHYKWFTDLLIWMVPTLLAVSWRETAKAWVCHLRGDPSVKAAGGTSLALSNLDPVGSALAPVLLILGHNTVYGWARTTEIRPNFLKRGQTDAVLAVCAGFLTNLIMAIVWVKVGVIAKTFTTSHPTIAEILLIAAKAGLQVNVILISVHLIPLPPMDMSYILRGTMPRYTKAWYTYIDPIGHHVVFLLFLFKIAPTYVQPIASVVLEQIQSIIS